MGEVVVKDNGTDKNIIRMHILIVNHLNVLLRRKLWKENVM